LEFVTLNFTKSNNKNSEKERNRSKLDGAIRRLNLFCI